MKKRLLGVMILWLVSSMCFASDSGFLYMLGVMEIPTENLNGYRINEEIYQNYHLFVYGTPEMITTRTKMEECFRRKVGEKSSKRRILGFGTKLSRKRGS